MEGREGRRVYSSSNKSRFHLNLLPTAEGVLQLALALELSPTADTDGGPPGVEGGSTASATKAADAAEVPMLLTAGSVLQLAVALGLSPTADADRVGAGGDTAISKSSQSPTSSTSCRAGIFHGGGSRYAPHLLPVARENNNPITLELGDTPARWGERGRDGTGSNAEDRIEEGDEKGDEKGKGAEGEEESIRLSG